MNMQKMTLLALCGSTAFLLAVRCANLIDQGGTDTGNGLVTAMLYNPDGTPAKHAKVMFYPVNYNPHTGGLGKTITAAAVDSTTTNDSGNYTATLDSGTYNIIASGSGNLAYQDSITAIKNDTVRPNPDTLKPAGSLRGIVRLEEGGDPTTVFILFMGTRTFTWPDDTSGSFTSDSMAAGTYRVRILTTTPNYKVLDTTLTVIAGTIDTLPQPIVLKFIGIPTPKNVKVSYDTAMQIVTLIWSKVDTGLVKGYNIYRRDVDSSFGQTPINGTTLVRDTVYRDTTGVQDKTYEYKVVAIDKGDNAGKMSAAVSVVIASYFVLDSTYGEWGSGQGQLKYPTDIAIAANGDIYIVDQDNNRVQVFDQAMQYKREFGGGILNIPFRIALDSLGNAYVSVQSGYIGNIFVFDPAGTLIDTIVIGKLISDIDLGTNGVYAIAAGTMTDDSVSVFSYDGIFKRTWWCSQGGGYSLIAENPNRIWVGSSQEDKLRVFDTLGNILDSIAVGPFPYGLAIDKTKGRIYINCLDNVLGNWLKVLDSSHKIIATYRIPCITNGESVVTGLHPDGSIYEVIGGGSNKVLRLRSLLP